MKITAYFSDGGTPKTGLTPSIDGWEVAGAQVITAQTMAEQAGGWYYYEFAGYNETKDYVFRCDGGATLTGYDRYTFGSNRDDLEISGKLPTNNFMGSSIKGDKDGNIDNIETHTGTDIPATITTMQVDLDNPNQYKTDVSALATSTALNTHDGKLDTVDGIVDDIKIKTNNLPTNTTTVLNKVLGISDENCYIDNYSFDSGKMSGCRKRIYNSKANAQAHGATGLLATYTVTVSWSGNDIQSYMMVVE